MANFPTNLDTIKKDWTNESPVKDTHPDEHNLVAESVEALETKVGVDGSEVTTTHDYKLSNVTEGDKAVSLTGTETLTNKTLTEPEITNPTGIVKGNVGLSNVSNNLQVNQAGDQTVEGVKTFSSSPIVPDPTTAQQPVTKKYFEDNSSSLGTSTAIEVTAFRALSSGQGLRFLGAGLTQGDANVQDNENEIVQPGDSVKMFQPIILIGTENNIKLKTRLKLTSGGSQDTTYSRTSRIYLYDESANNKIGTLIQTESKSNFNILTNFDDEWDYSPNSNLVKGTKYVISLEYIFYSREGSSSQKKMGIDTFQSDPTPGVPEAGYYEIIDRGSPNEGAGYVNIEYKQLPDDVDSIKLIEGTEDTTYNGDVIGFVQESVAIDTIANVKILGLISGFTGLTPGAYYKIDTDGSMILGTSVNNIGIAVTDTQFHFTGPAKQ